MKIGIICSQGIGGGDKNNLLILREYKRRNFPVILIETPACIPQYVPNFHYEGFKPLSRREQFQELGELNFVSHAEEINKFNLDLLHVHSDGTHEALIPGLRHANVNYKILESNFYGAMHTRADFRTFVSPGLVPKGTNYPVIPNAVAAPETTEDKRKELGLDGKFVFGRVARPDPSAFSDINLQAYAKIQSDNTAFLYIGPSPQARQVAQELGLKNVVWVEPTLSFLELSKLYNSMDVFCHAPKSGESFALCPAEAMRAGVPVVSVKGENPLWPQEHKLLFGEMTELYVENRSIDEYAVIMSKFKSDDEFYNRAATYLKDRINRFFSPKAVAEQYIKLYDQILRK